MTKETTTLLLSLAALTACAPKEKQQPASAAPPTLPTRVATAEGFSTPESVLWDAEQGVWFVSNIDGNPSAKDGNGFISRLRADGTIDSLRFAAGGRGGVVLNAPKGLALLGDTLWVTDIDAVRGFDRHSGAPVASVEFGRQAKFLNDLAAGPEGVLYVTDTGILFDSKGQMSHPGPDRLFALQGRKVTIAAEGDWLERPNGITWDASQGQLIMAPFGGPDLLAWTPGGAKPDTLAQGPGGFDGVEILPDGHILVSSWTDSTVHLIGDHTATKAITGVNTPADIGLDPARGWVAVPLFMDNRVEFWQLGAP